jgi:acetamidase/formamidase
VLKDVRIPIRPHFGVIGLAPSEADYVDSIPPHWVRATSTTGGSWGVHAVIRRARAPRTDVGV